MADEEARILSVIGGAKRTNRWRVAPDTTVSTFFGRCLLDLRRAETDADELWFGVTSAFASVEIIVPDGTVVQPSGTAFLAGSSCVVPDTDDPSPLPDIEIVATTVFGKLDIHTGDPRPRRGLVRWILRRPAKPVEVAPNANDISTTSVDDAPGVDLLAAVGRPTATPADDLDELDSMLEGALGGSDLLGSPADVDGLDDEAAPEEESATTASSPASPDGNPEGSDEPVAAS